MVVMRAFIEIYLFCPIKKYINAVEGSQHYRMGSIKVQVVEEFHKPTRTNYRRRRVIVEHLNDLIQADLVQMQPYARSNIGYRYMMIVIGVFSKFV